MALWQHPWKSILCHRNLLESYFPLGWGFVPALERGSDTRKRNSGTKGSGTLPRYRELFLAFPAPFLTFPVPSSQAPDDPAGGHAPQRAGGRGEPLHPLRGAAGGEGLRLCRLRGLQEGETPSPAPGTHKPPPTRRHRGFRVPVSIARHRPSHSWRWGHFGGPGVSQVCVLPAERVHQVRGADHQQPAPGHLALQDLQRAAGGACGPAVPLAPLSPPHPAETGPAQPPQGPPASPSRCLSVVLPGRFCFLHKMTFYFMKTKVWGPRGCCGQRLAPRSASQGVN